MSQKISLKKIKNCAIFFLALIVIALSYDSIFPCKKISASDMASVVFNVERDADIVNVKLLIDSNPGIAGMSFKIRYDKDALSVESVDETPQIFKSAVINPDGEGYIGYAYASVKNCKDTGAVISAYLKINNGTEFNSNMIYIDEFDACDTELADVNADIKTRITEEAVTGSHNTEDGVHGGKRAEDNTISADGKVSDNTFQTGGSSNSDISGNPGMSEKITSDSSPVADNTEDCAMQTSEKNTVKSTNVVIVIVIAVVVIAIVALLLLIKKKSGKTGGVKK